MVHLIVRLLLAVLTWLDPGCLRCECRAPAPVAPHRAPSVTPQAVPRPRRRPLAPQRPQTHTNAAKRLTQGRRRAELLLATYGIDAGPRRIHGVTVGAVR